MSFGRGLRPLPLPPSDVHFSDDLISRAAVALTVVHGYRDLTQHLDVFGTDFLRLLRDDDVRACVRTSLGLGIGRPTVPSSLRM